MTTPANLLADALRRDGARPFLTMYDAAGGRVELSVATTANWVAKTAGYLEDELGIEPGDAITVDPALHWLTAATLLAGWAIGADIAFSADSAAVRVEVPLDPMGAAFSRLVAAYPDHYRPPSPADVDLEITELPAGARLLTTRPLDAKGVDLGLLAPLSADGSVIYLADPQRAAEIAGTERVTHTTGVEVAGLPLLR